MEDSEYQALCLLRSVTWLLSSVADHFRVLGVCVFSFFFFAAQVEKKKKSCTRDQIFFLIFQSPMFSFFSPSSRFGMSRGNWIISYIQTARLFSLLQAFQGEKNKI